MEKDKVKELLDGVVHPETELGLVKGGFVEEVSVSDGSVAVVLKFRRARDPFAASLCRQTEAVLSEAFPEAKISVDILSPEKEPAPEPSKRLSGVKHIVAVASGKGGVGKSTVAANIAATLAAEGYRVGILDADIYGPSQPMLFEVEDYLPEARGEGADAEMVPAESGGVKIMSIGFFISPSDALVWRGPMAVKALSQLIRQTAWGELDFLIVDMPPGTGDVHLSLVQELELDGAIIVSTPGRLAVADVRRGVEMFRTEGLNVPVIGVIENMAWFTPSELPQNRYYLFGDGEARRFAAEADVEFLGDIPIVSSAGESGMGGFSTKGVRDELTACYSAIAQKIVDKLSNGC